ncbi:MAG: IPT/TIG domain-containing protein [Leptospiraceae bacterium]|nr:IPT/TIG domain-containing protein [Leptospiraceae bacterium]
MLVKIIILILFSFFLSCKDDTTTTNPIAAALTGSNNPYSPTIYSIDPKIGNPAFLTPNFLIFPGASYESTLVTIKGKNFVPSIIGNTILFDDVIAIPEYANEQEIRVRVPSGAKSGVLSVSNNGGVCYSLDKKSGFNCEGEDFYVNCYAPFQNIYGSEISIPTGTMQTIAYNKVTTRAFRSDLLYTNPYTNETSANTINIRCTTLARVLSFSQSCVPTEHQVDGNSITFNPVLSVNSKYFTIQYFITAGGGECIIRVN